MKAYNDMPAFEIPAIQGHFYLSDIAAKELKFARGTHFDLLGLSREVESDSGLIKSGLNIIDAELDSIDCDYEVLETIKYGIEKARRRLDFTAPLFNLLMDVGIGSITRQDG